MLKITKCSRAIQKIQNFSSKDFGKLRKFCVTTDQYYPKPTGPTGRDPVERERKIKPRQKPLPCPSQPCVRDDYVHCHIKRCQCPQPISNLKPETMTMKSELNPDHPLIYHNSHPMYREQKTPYPELIERRYPWESRGQKVYCHENQSNVSRNRDATPAQFKKVSE